MPSPLIHGAGRRLLFSTLGLEQIAHCKRIGVGMRAPAQDGGSPPASRREAARIVEERAEN